jgi:hypothetical protein
MANTWYFDHGCAGTNAGTLANPFNNLLSAFTGLGAPWNTIVAGDTVYVRCPTAGSPTIASIGAGVTTLFPTTPTYLLPINWIFDTGVIWAGYTWILWGLNSKWQINL